MSAAETDPRAILRAWSRFSIEVAPRVSPLLLLVRDAAAVDPEMHALRRELDEARLARMAHNARRLRATGSVRASPRTVRDVLWTATSPELYRLLVLERGWSLRAYARYIAETTIAALL
jgi:hypothetical protein